MFTHCSGLKTGIDFAHFGLELAMVFKGTTGVYEHTVHFNSKRVRGLWPHAWAIDSEPIDRLEE